MAEIEEAIKGILEADAAVTAIVGVEKIFLIRAAEDAGDPYVVFQQLGDNPTGESHDGLGNTLPRFQFSCYSNSALTARNLRSAVKTALQGFRGTVAGVEVKGGNKVNEQAYFDKDENKFRFIVDMRMAWGEC